MEFDDLRDRVIKTLPRHTTNRYDLLPLFRDNALFSAIVKTLSDHFHDKVDYVAAPEAIGWILGAAIAQELGRGFIGVRKGDHLPYAKKAIISTRFTDYSGHEKRFEMPDNVMISGKRILLVDDWIETGSQMKALITLFETLNCTVIGLATIGIDTNEWTVQWISSGFVNFLVADI